MLERWKIFSILHALSLCFQAGCERPNLYGKDNEGALQPHEDDSFTPEVHTHGDHSQKIISFTAEVRTHGEASAKLMTSEAQFHGEVCDKSCQTALLEVRKSEEPENALSYPHMDKLHDGEGPEPGDEFKTKVDVSKNFKAALETLNGKHWESVQATAKTAIDTAEDYRDKLKSLARQMGTGQANTRANGRDVSHKRETHVRHDNITVPLNGSDYWGKDGDPGTLKFPPDNFDFKKTNFTDTALKVGSGTPSTPSNGGDKKPGDKKPEQLNGGDEPHDKTPGNSGGLDGGNSGGPKPGTCGEWHATAETPCKEADETKEDDAKVCADGTCDSEKCCQVILLDCETAVGQAKCDVYAQRYGNNPPHTSALLKISCPKSSCSPESCCDNPVAAQAIHSRIESDGAELDTTENIVITGEVVMKELQGLGTDNALRFKPDEAELAKGDGPFGKIWNLAIKDDFLVKHKAEDGWKHKFCTAVGTSMGGPATSNQVPGCEFHRNGKHYRAKEGDSCLLKDREDKLMQLVKNAEGGGTVVDGDHVAHVYSDVFASVVVVAYKQGASAQAIECPACKCTKPCVKGHEEFPDKCKKHVGDWLISCCAELQCVGNVKKPPSKPDCVVV